MNRRALLATLGTSLAAGCATFDRPPTQPSPSPAPVPSDSPATDESTPRGTDDRADGLEQAWSLVEFRTRPVTVSLTGTRARTQDGGELAMRFARTADDDHPATVRGTFTNANPFENTFELGALPLFRNVPTAWPGGRPRDDEFTYRDELVLAPTGRHDLARTVPDLALADDDRWRLSGEIDGPWFPETRRLGAGESFRFEYALVGRPEGRGFPRARYHFEGHGEREVVFAVWSTDRPGPTGDSRFQGATPAPLPEADRMAWSHAAGSQSSTSLRPSAEHAELPAKVEFTFVNHARRTVSGNPYFWRLWKRDGGQWFHVAPWGWPLPLLMLPPGGTQSWTLAAFDDHAIHFDGARSVGHLGGGRYAFEVGMGREEVTHAALLEIDAPEATIEPTAGLDVTRDGTTVRIEWPRRTDEVPRATLTLTRARTADARLIPEQVMQDRNAALRNTLAYVEPGVDRVELVTDRNTVSRGARTEGYTNGSFRFTVDGQAYEATARFGDDG